MDETIESMQEWYCGSNLNWTLDECWMSDAPFISPCFQHSYLALVPCLLSVLLLPRFVRSVRASKNSRLQLSTLLVLKLVLVVLLIYENVTHVLTVWNERSSTVYTSPSWTIAPLITAATLVVWLTQQSVCVVHGVVSLGSLHMPIMLMATCSMTQLHYVLTQPSEASHRTYSILHAVWCSLLAIVYCFADRLPAYRKCEHSGEGESAERAASFLSTVTFSWFTSTVLAGYRRPLRREDVPKLNAYDRSAAVQHMWTEQWRTRPTTGRLRDNNNSYRQAVQFHAGKGEDQVLIKEMTSKTKGGSNVLASVLKMHKGTYLTAAFLKVLFVALQLVSPLILKALIHFVSDTEAPRWHGYAYAGALLLVKQAQTLLETQRLLMVQRAGMVSKAVLTTAVFSKTLLLSHQARSEKNVGEIVNLMSIDAAKFEDISWFLMVFWSSPLQIAVIIYLLYDLLGAAVFIGFSTVLITMVPVGLCIPIVQRVQKKHMKLKDERIALMSELLNGIKVIKLYAWELSFEEMVADIRRKEVNTIRTMALFLMGAVVAVIGTPFMISAVSFVAYLMLDDTRTLTPEIAFVSIALFNMLRWPLLDLPAMGAWVVQLMVSNRRLTEYLHSEQLDVDAVTRNSKSTAVDVQHASMSWAGGEAVLHDLTFSVESGQLVAIVGKVGAGKSSLLSALLGEMHKLDGGLLAMPDKLAYVAQQPWIQNMSFRDNITFGASKPTEWFDEVVGACALVSDIEMLPLGTATQIGEKGINLSGGQKQRVSLARALHSEADMYLLDDPLSAVDAHVARHIFDEALGPRGLLQGKTRLLVTHQLAFLDQCDSIIVVDDGRIAERGTYAELMAKGGLFNDVMEHMKKKERLQSTDSEPVESHLANGHTRDGEMPASILRQRSTITSVAESARDKTESKTAAPKFEEVETEAVGRVKLSVYLSLFSAMGYGLTALFLVLFTVSGACEVLANKWLATQSTAWSNATDDGTTSARVSPLPALGVYALLGLGQAMIAGSAAYVQLAVAAIRCSRQLHARLVHAIMRSPMSFFDVTPTGRILNRLGKDMDSVDQHIQHLAQMCWFCLLGILGTLLVVSISTPLFMVAIPPLLLVYVGIMAFYIAASRQLKRLESTAKSPVYAHFQETVQGAATIRAYGSQDEFIAESQRRVDDSMACYYPNIISDKWLKLRLELLGNSMTFLAALTAVVYAESGAISAGTIGLSMTYALNMTGALNGFVQASAMLEKEVVAVERIQQYIGNTPEAKWESRSAPAKEWPTKGRIVFDKYSTRYREGLELVLHAIDVVLQPGHRVGVVGRTGAGKSSLTLALLRLIEPASGAIRIDDVDITSIGLHDLRRRITIIPQDALLFAGTLRVNVDPTSKHSDAAIWTALEKAHLKDVVGKWFLAHPMSESGDNLSAGQRQLVCLARALLRHTKVLILDEATASVDVHTDALIQATIRAEFGDCTVLTIAHRINTIMDYDKILVLSSGRVMEYDSPKHLLDRETSVFKDLVREAGLL